jgi:hypothetical protein
MRVLRGIDADAVDHEDRLTSTKEAVRAAKPHARSSADDAARTEDTHAGDARREQVRQSTRRGGGDGGGVDDPD